jgi:hypothetical protein
MYVIMKKFRTYSKITNLYGGYLYFVWKVCQFMPKKDMPRETEEK